MNNFHNMAIQKVLFTPKKKLKYFIIQHIYQIVLNNSLDQPKQRKEIIFLQWTLKIIQVLLKFLNCLKVAQVSKIIFSNNKRTFNIRKNLIKILNKIHFLLLLNQNLFKIEITYRVPIWEQLTKINLQILAKNNFLLILNLIKV